MNGIPGIVWPNTHFAGHTFFGIANSPHVFKMTANKLKQTSLPPHVPQLMSAKGPGSGLDKTSNVTNSTEPEAIVARVFVGNLNTLALNKKDVQSIFGRYGYIIGLSLHKGYAFVQYKTEVEARSAVTGEDKRVYGGQQIDLNLASEPKNTKMKRKEFLHNTIGRSVARKSTQSDICHSAELHLPANNSPHARLVPFKPTTCGKRAANRHHPYCTRGKRDHDILICGNCKEMFSSLDKMILHKKAGCHLRFSCRCGPQITQDIRNGTRISHPLLDNVEDCSDIVTIEETSRTGSLNNRKFDFEHDNCSLTSESQISDSSLEDGKETNFEHLYMNCQHNI